MKRGARSRITTALVFFYYVGIIGALDLSEFFQAVDIDGDGQIEGSEAKQFMQTMKDSRDLSDAEINIEDSVDQEIMNAGFSYGGSSISSQELLSHLQDMLTGERVSAWVRHGLRLPQYAGKFEQNSIHGLDFPALLSANGAALASDLGVTSAFHRQKIHTAIVRQMFGLGAVPGPPANLSCSVTPCGSLLIQWDLPASPGLPPLHKYLVQRKSAVAAASRWQNVGDPSEESPFHLDEDPSLVPQAPYAYRVQSWGGHGPSEWALLEGCVTPSAVDSSCSIDSWNLHKKRSYPDPLPHPDGHREAERDPHRAQRRPELVSAAPDAGDGSGHLWSMFYSVNGGLLILALLSRSPLVARLLLTLLHVLKARFVWKVKLKYALSRQSPYGVVRAFARVVEAVAFCFVWLRSQADSLAQQSIGWRGARAEPGGPASAELPGAAGLGEFGVGLMSPAEHTWQEMIAAVKQSVASTEQPMIKPEPWPAGASLVPSASSPALSPAGLRLLRARGGGGSSSSVSSGEHLSDSVPEKVPSNEGRVESSRSASDSEVEEERGDLPSSSFLSRDGGGDLSRGRRRCNREGCPVRFDRWYSPADISASLSRHFCRDCQGVYCVRHTRISPHGTVGSCGLDSQCVCEPCFARLPAQAQAQLEASNRLRAGPPALAPPEQEAGTGLWHRHSTTGGRSGKGSSSSSSNGDISSSAAASGSSATADDLPSSSSRLPLPFPGSLGSLLRAGLEGSEAAEEEEPRQGRRRKGLSLLRGRVRSGDVLRGDGAASRTAADSPRTAAESGSVDGTASSGSSSGRAAEVEYSKAACELRWRMCHMWALTNRGSSTVSRLSGSSGRSAVAPGFTREPTSSRQEWGQDKPPCHPLTKAQKRWLKAGIWAIGKELEDRTRTGQLS